MEKGMIELTPIQASAYWCVNMMRNKIKEISRNKSVDCNEIEFLNIFYSYSDIEWRRIYVELCSHFDEIAQEMNGYEFSLDTELGGHNRLNQVLSNVLNVSIPDIRLAGYSSKDSVLYVTKNKVSVWYKSCGEMPLSKKYETDYVLTGNKEELDFYNLVLATIAMLGVQNPGFRSIPNLRKRFCEEYKKVHNDKELVDIVDEFNMAYKKANERELVIGGVSSDRFIPIMYSMDIALLEDYLDMGQHYADVILQRDEVFPLPVDNKLKKENS